MRLLKRHSKVFVLALLLVTTNGWAAENDSGTLVVKVEGLESDEGELRFVMFASKEDFLQRSVRAEIIAVSDQQGTWTVEDLPYGSYAVLVHHDPNGKGGSEIVRATKGDSNWPSPASPRKSTSVYSSCAQIRAARPPWCL